MLTAAKLALSVAPLRVLLVGKQEEDFFLIREILERTRSTFCGGARTRPLAGGSQRSCCNRSLTAWCCSSMKPATPRRSTFSPSFCMPGVSVPFHPADRGCGRKDGGRNHRRPGVWNCVAKSRLDGATLVRTIRSTLALHSMQQEQQTAEESLRKLSRAVEQSADTVMVTDCHGVIEYVNPAFETLTGYTRDEVCGKTPRHSEIG